MAREALVKNRTAAKNRAKALNLAILKRHSAEQLRQIERQMAAIEKEILTLIEAEPDLSRRFGILVSIPGISAITAPRSSSRCPNSARSVRARQPHSQASLPSHDSPGVGPAAPSFAAAGPMSDKRSTCRRSSPSDSIPISRQSTTSSKPPEKPQRSQSPLSCERSSCSQTHCSGTGEPGRHPFLDQHGYFSRYPRPTALPRHRCGGKVMPP